MKPHHFSVARLLFVLILSSFVLPAHAKQTEKLDELFNQEMLGVTVRYFESLAGIPRRSQRIESFPNGFENKYVVEGCTIVAEVDDISVQTLKLEITPDCQVNRNSWKSFLTPGKGPLIAGEFPSASYYADCLSNCGDSYIASVYLHNDGTEANDGSVFQAEITVISDEAIDAAKKWADIMEKSKGAEWVENTEFNCDETKMFNEKIPRNLFEKVKITRMKFGGELDMPGCM